MLIEEWSSDYPGQVVDPNRPDKFDPARKVFTPDMRGYEFSRNFNACEKEMNGIRLTSWTDECVLGPGNPINAFVRIEALHPPLNEAIERFNYQKVQFTAILAVDGRIVRTEVQFPPFYHVKRSQMGLEARLEDILSTSSSRVGRNREKWLPAAPYHLEIEVGNDKADGIRMDCGYIEFVKRNTPSVNPDRLDKVANSPVAIPRIQIWDRELDKKVFPIVQ